MSRSKIWSFSSIVTLQGWYYLITGIWPILSARSFLTVTGPKKEVWLVKTFGVVISVIGSVLILVGRRRKITAEIAILALGSAAGLAASDVIYVAKNRIRPIYLADAIIQAGLLWLWGKALRQRKIEWPEESSPELINQ